MVPLSGNLNLHFIILILVGWLQQLACDNRKCHCPATIPPTPGVFPKISSSFTLVDEIINGVNYGRPIIIGNLQFLDFTFIIEKSITSIISKCPLGYRLPTIMEYSTILSWDDNSYTSLQNSTGFKAISGKSYISSTKSYEGKTQGNDPQSWEFQGITFDVGKLSVFVDSINTFFDNLGTNIIGRCVLGEIIYDTNILQDFIFGVKRSVAISNPNIERVAFHYDNTTVTLNPSDIMYKTIGCNWFQSWTRNAANVIMYRCDVVFIDYKIGSNGAAEFQESDLKKIETKAELNYNTQIFNSFSNSPIAAKPDGGFYLLYSNKNDNNYLYIQEYDETNSFISSTNWFVKAWPFDICVVYDRGFAVYAKEYDDLDHSFIIVYDRNYQPMYTQVVMNNKYNPRNIMEQITFYNQFKESIPGLDMMFSPWSGELISGKNRIGWLFTHYNTFDNTLIDNWFSTLHGDSYLIVSSTNNDHTNTHINSFKYVLPTYGVSWISSPTLSNFNLYDGKYAITLSLSLQSPKNIRICIIDITAFTNEYDEINKGHFEHKSVCEDLLSTEIKGNEVDNSYARLGGIVNMKGVYAIVFSLKAETIFDSNGAEIMSDIDQIFIMTFEIDDTDPNNIHIANKETHTLVDRIARNLIELKIGKLGDKIFVMYYLDPLDQGDTMNYLNWNTRWKVYYMLVGFDGTIKTTSTEFTNDNKMITNSKIKTLKDGRLIWSAVDWDNESANVYITGAPAVDIEVDETLSKDDIVVEDEQDFSESINGTEWGAWVVLGMLVLF